MASRERDMTNWQPRGTVDHNAILSKPGSLELDEKIVLHRKKDSIMRCGGGTNNPT